jgi:hypothetical protein
MMPRLPGEKIMCNFTFSPRYLKSLGAENTIPWRLSATRKVTKEVRGVQPSDQTIKGAGIPILIREPESTLT